MLNRSTSLIGVTLVALLLAACTDLSDVASPVPHATFGSTRFSGSGVDTSLASGGGGGGGGGGKVGVSSPCGVLTTVAQPTQILVYTVRTGIGFSGQATNCSSSYRESFDISIVDQEPNAACRVFVPHYIAARNTSPGGTLAWTASSSPVLCLNSLHTFTVTLTDSQTGTVLSTTSTQLFL